MSEEKKITFTVIKQLKEAEESLSSMAPISIDNITSGFEQSALDNIKQMFVNRMNVLVNEYNNKYGTDYINDYFGNYMGTSMNLIESIFPKRIEKYLKEKISFNFTIPPSKIKENINYYCDMYEASVKEGIPFEWYMSMYGENNETNTNA